MSVHHQLYAGLQTTIQKWADGQCEKDTWPDFWMGEDTIQHMTNAAMAVLEACVESQAYAKREGYTS